MDQELFELCRDVYKKTKWDNLDFRFVQAPTKHPEKFDAYLPPVVEYAPTVTNEMIWTACSFTPLYTSDYLLDKLKDKSEFAVYRCEHIDGSRNWSAQCRNDSDVWGEAVFHYADTPIKALLGLVIDLLEAGELKAGDA